MRLVQFDKFVSWLSKQGYTQESKTIDMYGPLWGQIVHFTKMGNLYEVKCFCVRNQIPLVKTNNVWGITFNGVNVNIDFRTKFWRSVSLDTNERIVK